MEDIFKLIETPYIDAQALLSFLASYSKPREAILRMVKNGDLIRLKNGFYLIAEKIKGPSNQLMIPYEQVANWLYGPSYVSLEWALSFYGMIPERVYTVTSMTLGRTKDFHTSVGDFAYNRAYPSSFSIGVTQKKTADFVGGFLIASPEKALADWVYKTCKGLSIDELKQELLESKRVDRECFHQLDKTLLLDISRAYQTKSVNNLVNIVGIL